VLVGGGSGVTRVAKLIVEGGAGSNVRGGDEV